MEGVAPDGSPVAAYRALPAEPDFGVVRSALPDPIPAGMSLLELGSGPGRLTSGLTDLGLEVVAVDESPAMLAHIVGAETVEADIWNIDLGRRFDVVLAASNLINAFEPGKRAKLLNVCRRHVADDGIVIVQRYPPGWEPVEGAGSLGPVSIALHDVRRLDDGFAAAVTYTVDGRSWTQMFEATVVADEEMAALAAAAALRVDRALDPAGEWLVLSPLVEFGSTMR